MPIYQKELSLPEDKVLFYKPVTKVPRVVQTCFFIQSREEFLQCISDGQDCDNDHIFHGVLFSSFAYMFLNLLSCMFTKKTCSCHQKLCSKNCSGELLASFDIWTAMHENTEKEIAYNYMSNRVHLNQLKEVIGQCSQLTSTTTQAKCRTVITVSLIILE
jgi:hypothetical protein